MRHPAIEHELRWNREPSNLRRSTEQQLVIAPPADEQTTGALGLAVSRGPAPARGHLTFSWQRVIALHRAAGLTAAADPPSRGSPNPMPGNRRSRI